MRDAPEATSSADIALAVGPILVGLVAVAVAVLVNRRTLAHSENMQDLSAKRAAIDDALVALDAANAAWTNLQRRTVDQLPYPAGPARGSDEPWDPAWRNAVDESLAGLRYPLARLRVLMGRDHVLVALIDEVSSKVREGSDYAEFAYGRLPWPKFTGHMRPTDAAAIMQDASRDTDVLLERFEREAILAVGTAEARRAQGSSNVTSRRWLMLLGATVVGLVLALVLIVL
ncbi:hypothetical protein [Conexibacter sp. CPCC 206217]|uniref:hypothetical protein n=1 Tax=Conexibacter sp. CPCC 206217 TaxID=3064574 RepID=UPI002719F1CF|nr:hypothetical protein [Conexibacter sp. CPCC 206217]MDO8208950.1 hypothetical protein [Conexibacter sp. CPCC 206217]